MRYQGSRFAVEIRELRALVGLCASLGTLFGVSNAWAIKVYNPPASAPESAADGICSLSEAIRTINTNTAIGGCTTGTAPFTINLAAGTYNITTNITIKKSVLIQGVGSGAGGSLIRGNITAPGDSAIRVEELNLDAAEPTVDFKKLALDHTSAQDNIGLHVYNSLVRLDDVRVSGFTQGGILNEFGTLEISNSTIENNTSSVNGAGIAVDCGDPDDFRKLSALVVRNSSILNNHAFFGALGGGIFYHGNGNSNLYNVTLGDNSAEEGGAIYVQTDGGGYFDAVHLTVKGNEADLGGGIYEGTLSGTNMRLSYSLFDDNTSNNNAPCRDAQGPIQSTRNRYQQTNTPCSFVSTSSDVYNTVAQLGTLMDMGGNRTLVYPTLTTSPARDAISVNSGEVVDGRGFLRPIDGDENGTVRADTGAFEYNPRWESEKLVVAETSGDAHTTPTTPAGYSQGAGTQLAANAVNDFVKYQLPIAETGNYKVRIRVRTNANAATFRLATATSVGGTYTNIGGTVNLNAASGFTEVDLTPGAAVLALTTGQRFFRAQVTTCPAGGCPIHIDYIKLVKQ